MMHSPAHSSRTSPSFTMSPRQQPREQDDDIQPVMWNEGDTGRTRATSDGQNAVQNTSTSLGPIPTHGHSASTQTSCPPATGKIRNQLDARKSIEEALADCGDDDDLREAVIKCLDCEEYKSGKMVPAELLNQLSEIVGVRSHSRCRFPGCGKLNVRTDRAKEHARVHIGNHPYPCTRVQSDGHVGCGATFLRKHDRNRHNNGADVLTCEDCGAHIQGKGREYNLQRHKANYCSVRKAAQRQTPLGRASVQSPRVRSSQTPESQSLPLLPPPPQAFIPQASRLPNGHTVHLASKPVAVSEMIVGGGGD